MTTLMYHRPSHSWLDRLPLGNGRLGAMVGIEEGGVRIGLNESSLWSGGPQSARTDTVSAAAAHDSLQRGRALFDAGRPVDAERELATLSHRYAQSFLPLGELVIATPDLTADVERSLALSDAVHTAVQKAPLTSIRSRTATLATPDVLLHELRIEGEPTPVEISFSSPLRAISAQLRTDGLSSLVAAPGDAAPAHEPAEPAHRWDVDGVTPVHAAVEVHITHDGEAIVDRDVIRIRDAVTIRVVLAAATTFDTVGTDPRDPAEAIAAATAQLRASSSASADDLLAAHIAARRSRHDRMRLRLGPHAAEMPFFADTIGEAAPSQALTVLFDYGRYLLSSCSRAGGLPANLQGIWNNQMQPPWSSDYTLNINTPMNYWGAETTGASDAHLALLELLEGLAFRGADTAQRLYGCRGWVAHHNTDAWAYSEPTRGDASWALWPFGGAWLVRQFDEHRRFGAMSPATAQRFWPVVHGCAQFLLDFSDRADGSVETFPSTSPENTYIAEGGTTAAITTSSALDRALIREVLETTVALAAESGHENDPIVARSRSALTAVDGPRISQDGTITEWGEHQTAADPGHRHISHLFPWFPGDSGVDARHIAVAKTLDVRGDDSTGWSLAWKLALAARIGDGDRAARLLPLVTRQATEGAAHRAGLYPNLFAAHPPFQIDGNLGLVGALAEMIVQSQRPGRIDLLRGLPSELSSGEVTDLVARPGITVDLYWSAGRPQTVSLLARTPRAAGPRTLVFANESVTIDLPLGKRHTITWADHAHNHRQEHP
ncbi:glycosyl hydrolase family 95 catalytic domain-containing protein [Microbacterium sp. A82]|uniref:glycosyl hydrolase family 95 catalytic domain-containing protein n=1 Tax=Microbacterium sp. A82 TaxID=3450452 RepID=UPI003F2AAC71